MSLFSPQDSGGLALMDDSEENDFGSRFLRVLFPESSTTATTTLPSTSLAEMAPSLTAMSDYVSKSYCGMLQYHGFSCNDAQVFSSSEIVEYCVNTKNLTVGTASEVAAPDNGTTMIAVGASLDECAQMATFSRINIENERLFYVYLYVATPLVIIALIFNTIALTAIIAKLPEKLSRHFILCVMSISDAIVSLSALLRRVDASLMGGQAQPYLIAVWQTTWFLSALSLVGLAVDMFVALAKPYLYGNKKMKFVTVIAIIISVVFASLMAVFLAVFKLQESDNSQYFACGVVVVIISVISVSHIYACVSAEKVQMQMKTQATQFGLSQMKAGSSNLLRKSIVTTTLLIISSLLSWIPLLIYWLISESTIERQVPLFIHILTLCLICFHMNAVFNPLIYSLRFRDVRGSVKRLFRGCLCPCCPEKVTNFFNNRGNRRQFVTNATPTKSNRHKQLSSNCGDARPAVVLHSDVVKDTSKPEGNYEESEAQRLLTVPQAGEAQFESTSSVAVPSSGGDSKMDSKDGNSQLRSDADVICSINDDDEMPQAMVTSYPNSESSCNSPIAMPDGRNSIDSSKYLTNGNTIVDEMTKTIHFSPMEVV